MAATKFAALKVEIVTWAGVAGRIWRDKAPEGSTFPYVVITADIVDAAVLRGDRGKAMAYGAQDQVTLFQTFRDESAVLVKSLRDALEDAVLSVDGRRTMQLRVDDTRRIAEQGPQIVGHALTLTTRYLP